MHRMTQLNRSSFIVAAMALAVCTTIGVLPTSAAPPDVRHADVDYDASGYVTPAGMAPPSMYQGGVMPVGYNEIMQVGYSSSASCDGGCDAPATCDGYGSCGDPGCGTGIFDSRSKNSCDGDCGGQRCGILGCGLSKLRHLCVFCRGGGCSVCQCLKCSHLVGALHCLKPFGDRGICSQRWYDVSIEGVGLSHSNGGLSGPVTSLGVAPLGPIVLQLGDADGGNDVEGGVRLSGAFIFGVGGNIEGTYMGGNEWSSEAGVADPAAGLFSFVSDFGTNPGGTPPGFDDTDRSLFQGLRSTSEFHSGELNYRRRLVGPYCRFQGSWLVGLRYVRFENGLSYGAFGEDDNTVNADLRRFFGSDDSIKNNLFGPQVGFDLWWNVCGGVRLGFGMKGAWVQNDIDRRTTLTANSLIVGSPGTAVIEQSDRDGTVMGEFEGKFVWRISHSWAIKTAYYAVAADDIAFGTVDRQTIRDFVQLNPISDPAFHLNSLVVQGGSIGAEYTW